LSVNSPVISILRNGNLADRFVRARQLYESDLAEMRRMRELIGETKPRAASRKIPAKGATS